MVEKRRQSLAICRAYKELDDDVRCVGNFQRTLLPTLPSLDWLEVASYYRPMDGVAGGDIYDFFLRSPDQLRVLVIDVSGHGVQGAIRTAIVDRIYDGIRSSLESPHRVLTELNRIFFDRYSSGDLGGSTVSCTALCADIAPRVGGGLFVTISGASQERPVYTRQGRIEQIDTVGFALGCMEDVGYQDTELTLDHGERLYLFTDGIMEQQNEDGEMFAARGFESAVLSAAKKSHVQVALDTLVCNWNSFRGDRRIGDLMANQYSRFGLILDIKSDKTSRIFSYRGNSKWMPERDEEKVLSSLVLQEIESLTSEFIVEIHIEDLRLMNSSTLKFLLAAIGKTVRTGCHVKLMYDPNVRPHGTVVDSVKAVFSAAGGERVEIVPTPGQKLEGRHNQ